MDRIRRKSTFAAAALMIVMSTMIVPSAWGGQVIDRIVATEVAALLELRALALQVKVWEMDDVLLLHTSRFLRSHAMDFLSRGHMLADISAILGSLDIVFGEIDR